MASKKCVLSNITFISTFSINISFRCICNIIPLPLPLLHAHRQHQVSPIPIQLSSFPLIYFPYEFLNTMQQLRRGVQHPGL